MTTTKRTGTDGKRRGKTAKAKRDGRRKTVGKAAESARKLALAIAEAGLDKRAVNIEIIDVRGKVDYADFVVVMSGRSDRQVTAIGRAIEEHVKKRLGVACLGVEGLPHGNWVLMDFGEAIVHVFHEDTRGYYDLESLWIDAARVQVEPAQA